MSRVGNPPVLTGQRIDPPVDAVTVLGRTAFAVSVIAPRTVKLQASNGAQLLEFAMADKIDTHQALVPRRAARSVCMRFSALRS